jgi:RNase P subunit RPR2
VSDSINNGGPQNLRNAMNVMRREVHRMEKVARRHRKQGLLRGPRQYCSVCGTVFDYAIVDPEAALTAAICAKCKVLLAEGYTACITSEKYAFIRSEHLKTNGMNGKVVQLSDEAFKKLEDKFNAVPPKESTPET